MCYFIFRSIVELLLLYGAHEVCRQISESFSHTEFRWYISYGDFSNWGMDAKRDKRNCHAQKTDSKACTCVSLYGSFLYKVFHVK